MDENELSVYENGVRILTKLPKLVLFKFRTPEGEDLGWRLPGLDENGLYPILPKNGQWFLDKGRQHAVFKITRRQLPLAPAFAMTAHASQGQTLKGGAIVDLRKGKGSNPLGSYVAMTRVQSRRDLLVYRLFPLELFTQGPRKGPEFLLKHLRREPLNW